MKSSFRLFAALGFASVLSGQSETPSAHENVSVAFTVVGWGKPIEGLGYRQNGAWQKLAAGEFERSAVYNYTGPKKMNFYRLPAPSSAAARSTLPAPIVGAVTFDPSIKRATVLLSPVAGSYEAIIIPEDPDKFPPGHALLLNATLNRLGVLCNQSDTVVLAPRERRLVAANRRGELDAEVAWDRNGAWERLERNHVPVRAERQTIIAFIKDPEGGEGVRWIVFRQKPTAPKTRPRRAVRRTRAR